MQFVRLRKYRIHFLCLFLLLRMILRFNCSFDYVAVGCDKRLYDNGRQNSLVEITRLIYQMDIRNMLSGISRRN